MLCVMNLYCEGDESCNAVQLRHTFCQNILTVTSLGVAGRPIRHSTPKPKIQETKNKIDLEKERMKKAKEEKREAKQAQITAGKELASKLFSAKTPRTSTNVLHKSDSAEESALRGPKKKQKRLNYAKKRTRKWYMPI